MICNNSWQGRFVSGRNTALMLLGVSLLMWLVGFFFDVPINELSVFGLKIGNVMSRSITFACFALAVAMMSSWYVFERRIRWFLPISFYLPSVSLFLHGSVEYSLSLLFFQLIIHRLFSCKHGEDCRYSLFSAFVLFGLATMLFPQFIMLLPVFVCYIYMTSLVGNREFLSIVLGLLTPYWFLFGIDFIFPDVVEQSNFFIAPLIYVFSGISGISSITHTLLLAVGVLVVVPFIMIFSNSPSPGKPLLRKRLLFFALLNIYLMALSMLYSKDFILYYIWSLPALSVMLTFVFSLNITRFSRYYFIIINLMWLAMLPFSLWLIH